jgi:predicted metal-dependent peptidase
VWHASKTSFEGRAQIYLDVSGSMDAEMPLLIALFGRLSNYIKRPFWAFSDVVSPATITNGQLKTDTSGGTTMACVLEHIAETRPASAVVVTDGYIEQVDRKLMARTASTKIHAIVTRDGSPAALKRIGMPYTQLDEVPS